MTTPQISSRTYRRDFILTTLVLAGALGALLGTVKGQDPPPAPAPVADGADPQGAQAPNGDPADPAGPQVLTRGPIHEAFATPVVHNPASGPIVPKQPPDPIQEMPPDQKPAGQNVQWIPGYWSWDVSRNDYLWVSGIWRDPPPNSQWVPGYWQQVEGGSQWVSGMWIPVSSGLRRDRLKLQRKANRRISRRHPLKALKRGRPHRNRTPTWPGHLVTGRGKGRTMPGDRAFGGPCSPTGSGCRRTTFGRPSGYLFVAGYWDLPVANRGLMFAPVYYPQPVYAQANFVFTPSIAIVGSAVTANLFVSEGSNQYLFGNFYGQSFLSVGITPWFSFAIGGGQPAFYDPLFSYYAVINVRQNPGWVAQVRRDYVLRRDNVAMRPPVTYAEQSRLIERNVAIDRSIAMPLDRLAAERGMRLEHVNEAERQLLRQKVAQLHQLRDQRIQQEREGARARAAGGVAAARPRPMNLAHSPIAAHPAAHQEAAHGAATHTGQARDEEAHRAEAERRSPHATPAEGRQGEMSRSAPRGEAAARRPKSA